MNKQTFHATIWSKLLTHNRQWDMLRPGDRVLAAVSGGPDSACLAHYLSRLASRLKLEVRILHLHHGLRGRAADRDALLVESLGKSLGLPVVVRRIPVAAFARKTRRSLEDAGRLLRYRALAREARLKDCNKIATGHQQDDQAETVILNLLRGTKAEGLAGVPPRRPLSRGRRGITVIRPLLCLTRREVIAYLKHHRLKYSMDRSNRSLRFTRNWVRWKVLPLLETKNPEIREHLSKIALDARRRAEPCARRGSQE